VSEYFVQTSHGVEGPYTLSQVVALKEDGHLDDNSSVSLDRSKWETLGTALGRFSAEQLDSLDKSIFVNCPRCEEGLLKALPTGQKIWTILFSAFLLGLLFFLGFCATRVLEYKMLEIEGKAPPKSQWPNILLVTLAVLGWSWYLAQNVFMLTRKWLAIFKNECPWCETGFIRRGQSGVLQTALYFVDAFVFQEILFPIYKTLTFQWLWRDYEALDDERPGFFKTIGRFIGFSFVIFGAAPFLWVFSAENSILGLGFSVFVVILMFRLIFAKNAKNTVYRKGVVFLMLPLYFVCMVEVIRWCLVVTLRPGDVPPDISDLYLKGLDTVLQSGIFMDVPRLIGIKLSTLQLEASWKSLSLTGFAVFFTKLILNAALIVALVKSFTLALFSTRIFHRTGQRGARDESGTAALKSVEELSREGSPSSIDKVATGIQDVASALLGSRLYLKSVASSAEAGSEQQLSALKALKFVENDKLTAFATGAQEPKSDETEQSNEEGAGEATGEDAGEDAGEDVLEGGFLQGWGERGLSVYFVGIWMLVFFIFFAWAIETAIKREIADLLERAADPQLEELPLARRKLYEKVLRKASDNHKALRFGAATDMDVAEQRVNLLDMDGALIDIDLGFNKLITLESLTGLENDPYSEERTLLGARAYALRGRIFFFKADPPRAIAELRKERTLETRRLLFALGLDKAAEDLLSSNASRQLRLAKGELGIDEEYAAASLIDFARALLTLKSGRLEEGAKALNSFLGKADSFSKGLRVTARYLRVRALLQLKRLKEANEECQRMLKESADFDAAYLEYGHLLRQLKKYKESLKAHNRAGRSKNTSIRDHGQLAGILVALKLGDKEEAKRRLLDVARRRDTDQLFRNDMTDFIQEGLPRAVLLSRSARWGGGRHKTQMALARLVIGIKALAENDLGTSALEFRRVYAQVAPTSAEAELAAALLDEIQVRREGRSYQSERFYHKTRLENSGRLIRLEIRRILFAADQIAYSLGLALNTDDAKERAQALKAVASGRLVPAKLLIPHLIKALEDKDADVRLAALEALAENKRAQEANEKITSALKDKDERVRRAAVRVMEGFRGAAAVLALSTALADKDRYVRRDAAYALAKFGSLAKSALGLLIERLNDDKVMVRDAALAGVKAQGQAGARALAKIIGRPKDSYISIQTVQHLERNWPRLFTSQLKEITGFLLDVLQNDKDPTSRRWAAQKLAQLKYDKRVAAPAVLELIKKELKTALKENTDPALGITLASAILRASRSYGIDGQQAIDHYMKELRARPALREDLLGSLLAPGVDEAAVPIIDGMIQDKSLAPDSQRLLRTLLERSKRKKELGQETIQQLKKHLDSDDEELTERVAEVFAVIGETLDEEISAPLFVKLLSDPSSNVRDNILDVISLDFDEEIPDDIALSLRAGILSKDKGIQSTHFGILRDVAFEDESLMATIEGAINAGSAKAEICCGALWAMARQEDRRAAFVKQATLLADNENEELSEAALILLLSATGPSKTADLVAKAEVAVRVRLLSALLDWLDTPQGEDQGEAAVACLLTSLKDTDEEVQAEALASLGKVEIEEDSQRSQILATVRKIRSQSQGEVSDAAQVTLLSLAPEKLSKTAVAEALKGEDSELASRIIDSLVALSERGNKKKAADYLVAALQSEDESIRSYAIDTLKDFGSAAHLALKSALESGDKAAQTQALSALAKQGKSAQSLAMAVVALLKSPRPAVARAAVRTLGRIASSVVRPSIRALASRTTPSIKAECFIALGRLGDKDSGKKLEQLLQRGMVAKESEYLARSLLEIEPERGLRYLTGALRSRYGRVPATVAARLLGDLGAKAGAVLPDLEALRTDPNPKIRAAATAAVLRIRRT
jgi:HEAT repeat protein